MRKNAYEEPSCKSVSGDVRGMNFSFIFRNARELNLECMNLVYNFSYTDLQFNNSVSMCFQLCKSTKNTSEISKDH